MIGDHGVAERAPLCRVGGAGDDDLVQLDGGLGEDEAEIGGADAHVRRSGRKPSRRTVSETAPRPGGHGEPEAAVRVGGGATRRVVGDDQRSGDGAQGALGEDDTGNGGVLRERGREPAASAIIAPSGTLYSSRRAHIVQRPRVIVAQYAPAPREG